MYRTPEFWLMLGYGAGAIYYVVTGGQPGKALYWVGATILTLGVLKMRG